jgi:transcriptional regulator with XRE-family HTH domain
MKAGLGSTAIKDILSGKSRDPGAATLGAIAEVLGVELSALLEAGATAASTLSHVKLAPRFLPVRYIVQAGHWYEVDAEEPPEQVALAVPDTRYPNVPQWLEKVVGDSVDLKIPPGHYVHVVDAIELGYVPKHGHWVVVERQRDQGATRERTIKQVEITPDGRILLCPRSSNARWNGPIELAAGVANDETAEVRIVGRVIHAIDPDF